VADRQPAVLLLLGHTDGLAADRPGNDGADGLGGVHGLLEEGGILQLGLTKPRLRMTPLDLVIRGQPSLHSSAEFGCHWEKLVVPPTGSGSNRPLCGVSVPDQAIELQVIVALAVAC
jgi:hypothetical protein